MDRTRTLRRGDLAERDLKELTSAQIIAWDIETSGLDFGVDQIGTVQVADDAGRSWLIQIDPGVRPEILCSLLANASVRKVFHFAPFDLGFMRRRWGARAQNVSCTKVLDRLVNPRAASHSLKDVLLRELEIALPKPTSVRRSDWSVRDLSAEQVSYALSDVEHLIGLYDALVDKATRHGVSRIAEQSFSYLPVRVETELLGIEDLFAY